MKRVRRKSKQRSQLKTDFQAIKRVSFILTGLIALGGLIYYVSHGIPNSSAFEQFPRSVAYYVADQSGLTQSDKYGAYGVHYARPGDTVTMWVTVKNLSKNPAANVWYPESELTDEGTDFPNAHAIGIGPVNDVSPFWLDSSSFVSHGNRLAYYDGPAVSRGKYMTLAWQVKIANDAVLGSTYPLSLGLMREFDEWGVRVTSAGRNTSTQAIRWVFKISNMNVYPNTPINNAGSYRNKLIYQDFTDPLAEKIFSYDLISNQTTQIFSRTRADYYSPNIYTRLADPLAGIFWVGQTINDQWGYGDKWLLFTDPLMQFFTGGNTQFPITGSVAEDNWWDVSACFMGWNQLVAVEKYLSTGITIFAYSSAGDSGKQEKMIGSYFPRLMGSPWDLAKFSGYAKKVWSPACSKLYLGRCDADNREDCDKGLSTWQFDQATFADNALPHLWQMGDPVFINSPQFDLNSVLTEQQFNTIEFSPGIPSSNSTGTLDPAIFDLDIAIGSTYSLKNNIPMPPSQIKSVLLNTGAVQTVGKSNSAAFRVEKVSADGDWMFYTMRNSTGATDDVKTPRDKMVAFISRVGDIYQPLLISQDFDHLKVLGWTQDNRYLVFIEYSKCNSLGCTSKLKVYDTQNRSTFTPVLPTLAVPIAVV